MGNMAKAIAEGIIKSGKMSGKDIYAYAPHQDKLKKNAEAIGFMACESTDSLRWRRRTPLSWRANRIRSRACWKRTGRR